MPYSTTTGGTNWWVSSPYYQQYGYNSYFSIYEPRKVRNIAGRYSQKPPPKEPELKGMTDEEFNGALNELLFGGNE